MRICALYERSPVWLTLVLHALALRRWFAPARGQRYSRCAGCIILVLVASLPSLSYSESAGATQTLRLATSNLPPVVNPDGEGYLDRILHEISLRTRIAFEVQKLPAARGLALADAGVLDGEVARTDAREEQYPQLRRVPEPIIDIVVAGLHTREGIRVKSLDDFSKYRVGHVRGWKFVESLFADSKDVTITRTVTQLMEMLAADRIDIAIMTVAPGRFMARERGMKNLIVTDYAVRKDMFLYLHESHADINSIIDSAIKSMKQDGSYAAIIQDYDFENQ